MRWQRIAIGTVALSTALALLPAVHASAGVTAGGRPTSLAEFAALTPDQQAAILAPLRAVAGALDDVGRTSGAGSYGDVVIDPVGDVVDLYATSPAGAAQLTAAAKQKVPSIDAGLIRVKTAAYTKEQLHAAREKLRAARPSLPYHIVTVAVAVDGSGLEVGVDDPAAALAASTPVAAGGHRKDPGSVAGVHVVVKKDAAAHGDSRYADSAPYYAGGYIKSGGWACTTGLPVQYNSNGDYAMVTAAHCAHYGEQITNGSGTYEGTVADDNEWWDAAIYPVYKSGADEFDSGPWDYDPRPLSGTKYSYNGDWVCQDGFTSGVVCNIQVVNQDYYSYVYGARYNSTYEARGVEGRQYGGTAVREGDSGGLVFAIPYGGATVREVRGLVSATPDGVPDGIFWTEALDIYNAFGVHLTNLG